MDGLGTGPSSALDSTYGAMLIGVLFATFFQGLLTVQTYNYYENYPTDPIRIKITVAVVWCLDTIQLVLIAQSAYHYFITNWGYQPALINSTWELCLQLTFIGLSCFVCQLFFLGRIWVFSKGNIFIVGFILAVCLTTLAIVVHITSKILRVPFVTEFGEGKGEIIAMFMSGAVADVLITGFLCYYLQRDRSNFEATRSLLGKILQFTVATGLATSALAISSIIAYLAHPEGFYFIGIHFCLGRLYTNALLATLNARYKMRTTLHEKAQQKSSDNLKPETDIQGIESTRYLWPFPSQVESRGKISSEDAGITYTIDQITDRDLELGRMQGGLAPSTVKR